jgi:pyrimidine-nucleoside phosphorylase
MKTVEDAEALASAMVEIGTQVGRVTSAVISDMDQPLGYAIGNALEVMEAIDTLKGKGPDDLTELCLTLGAHMIVLGGKTADIAEAKQILKQKLENGEALAKFAELISAQGGDPAVLEQTELLPQAALTVEVTAEEGGYVGSIQAEQLGLAAMLLGAGRATKEAQIDYAVGLVLRKKVGDAVAAGESLATLHVSSNNATVQEVAERVRQAYGIVSSVPAPKPLLLSIVTAGGIQRV